MNTGSTSHQRGQKEYALRWGWAASAVEVVEDDLGMSGTSGEKRKGWQALLKQVANEQVGVILASDSSRLTRSSADFETLLGLCRATNTLLAVEGVIVDCNDPANRMLARLRANVAEYENELRTDTFMKAKRTKARQGHAVSICPTGYVVSQKGRWAKDPDPAVRQMVEEIFKQYRALGTVGKVVRFFAEHRLLVPVRRGITELRWVRATRSRVYQTLWNPAFAGYYVYGRRSTVKGAPRDTRRQNDSDAWIKVADHHEPYISPADWHQMTERLRSHRVAVSQPAGRGPALCQGLMWCGRCGHRMRTHYHHSARGRRITYLCSAAYEMHREPLCWHVAGDPVDEVVATELLGGLTPPNVEAVIAAAGEVNAGYEAACRQRQTALDRVRGEADVAQRRFKSVDPSNRLVAASLEHDLERALERVREVERQHEETPLVPPLQATPDAVDAIRRLTVDLPELWAAPTTTNEDRKALVRLLVREIWVVAASEVECEVAITWVGRAVTRHRIMQPLAGWHCARRLASEGLQPDAIAAELNRRGIRSTLAKRPYTGTEVHRLLREGDRRAGMTAWRTYKESLRAALAELAEAGWSNAAIAAEFNRRGLRTFVYRTAWNQLKIRQLRRTLGVPYRSGPSMCRKKTPPASRGEG